MTALDLLWAASTALFVIGLGVIIVWAFWIFEGDRNEGRRPATGPTFQPEASSSPSAASCDPRGRGEGRQSRRSLKALGRVHIDVRRSLQARRLV